MTVIDEIKTDAKEIKASAEECGDLFLLLARGKEVTEKIETSRGEFTVKYPKQRDLLKIGRLVAFKHGGLSAECFDSDTESLIKITSYLEIVVIDGPAWYKNARAEKENWSWEDAPDAKFLTELFVKAQEFRGKVAESFERKPEEETGGVSADGGDADAVGDGLFSGFAGRGAKS